MSSWSAPGRPGGASVLLLDENPVPGALIGTDVPLFFGGRMTAAVQQPGRMLEQVFASNPALETAFEAGVDVRLGTCAWGLYVNGPAMRALAAPVLRHRILLNYKAEAEGVRVEDVIKRLVAGVKLPALMGIRSLELRARAVVEGFISGMHRSPYHGFSVEFTEYRQYSPGDDPRYLDWRVVARSDRYYIKKYEDETNLRCHLLVDQSRSMNFGTRGHTKAAYAATLAATLAYFLHMQGDATGLLTFDEQVREFLPPRHRAGHLRQLMHALERPPTGRTTDLTAPLDRMANLVRKRGLVAFVSDFLAPLDQLEKKLLVLTAC
eukprot:gene4856-6613_t